MKPSGLNEGQRLSGQTWTEVTVHHVYVAFLCAEWHKLIVPTTLHDRQLIDQPDLSSYSENQRRAELLYSYRAPLLQRMPADTRLYEVRYLQEGHLDELLVIGRCGWDSPHDGNELLQVARRKLLPLRSQPQTWSAPILWGHTRQGPFTILEGNNRLVAFAGADPRPSLRRSVYAGLSGSLCFWHLPDPPPAAGV